MLLYKPASYSVHVHAAVVTADVAVGAKIAEPNTQFTKEGINRVHAVFNAMLFVCQSISLCSLACFSRPVSAWLAQLHKYICAPDHC